MVCSMNKVKFVYYIYSVLDSSWDGKFLSIFDVFFNELSVIYVCVLTLFYYILFVWENLKKRLKAIKSFWVWHKTKIALKFIFHFSNILCSGGFWYEIEILCLEIEFIFCIKQSIWNLINCVFMKLFTLAKCLILQGTEIMILFKTVLNNQYELMVSFSIFLQFLEL